MRRRSASGQPHSRGQPDPCERDRQRADVVRRELLHLPRDRRRRQRLGAEPRRCRRRRRSTSGSRAVGCRSGPRRPSPSASPPLFNRPQILQIVEVRRLPCPTAPATRASRSARHLTVRTSPRASICSPSTAHPATPSPVPATRSRTGSRRRRSTASPRRWSAEAIRTGPGNMPRFGPGTLSPTQVERRRRLRGRTTSSTRYSPGGI